MALFKIHISQMVIWTIVICGFLMKMEQNFYTLYNGGLRFSFITTNTCLLYLRFEVLVLMEVLAWNET